MQSNESTKRRYPAWFCVLTTLAFGVMFAAVPGCDPCMQAEVDDGDPCTVDMCEVGTNGEAVVTHEDLCLADEVCIEVDGEGVCVECAADADCDALQICVANVCEDVDCIVDADCDDDLFFRRGKLRG